MQEEDWKKFISESKNRYYQIGATSCPAFDGELIYFNKHGWQHLLRKGRFVRDRAEQYRRIEILAYVEYILRRTMEISEFKENTIEGHPAYFWTIQRYVNNISIRIIIRKLNGGRKHFFSIMDEDNEKIP